MRLSGYPQGLRRSPEDQPIRSPVSISNPIPLTLLAAWNLSSEKDSSGLPSCHVETSYDILAGNSQTLCGIILKGVCQVVWFLMHQMLSFAMLQANLKSAWLHLCPSTPSPSRRFGGSIWKIRGNQGSILLLLYLCYPSASESECNAWKHNETKQKWWCLLMRRQSLILPLSAFTVKKSYTSTGLPEIATTWIRLDTLKLWFTEVSKRNPFDTCCWWVCHGRGTHPSTDDCSLTITKIQHQWPRPVHYPPADSDRLMSLLS